MKKTLILLFTLFASHYVSAQYFKSDWTIGGGATFLYGDLDTMKAKLAPAAFIRYAISPIKGFSIGVDIQGGMLESTYSPLVTNNSSYDPTPFVSNSYFSGSIDFRVKPFQLFYDCAERFQQNVSTVMLKSIYLGVGIGGIVNHVNFKGDPNYFSSISKKTSSTALRIPLNAGFDIPLQTQNRTAKKAYFLNFNSQFNFSNNDWIDGINDNSVDNKKKDFYSFYSLGFVMKFR